MTEVTAPPRITRSALLRAAVGLAGSGLAGSVLAACAGPLGGGGGSAPAKVEGTVEIVSTGEADPSAPAWQARAAAINAARVGAQKIWAGTVHIHPNAKTGAHHHGALESVIYIVSGRARMRWGEKLEFVAEAGPGDFIFVPPYVPHQEINASTDETLRCVLVRSDNEAVVVNLDIEPVEKPEAVLWIDPIHKNGGM